MFVELLEKLRCPRDHEDSPLIATASRTTDRNITEGTLGCFVCHAEYEIHDGVVDFGADDPRPLSAAALPADDRTMRLGALLGLDDRGGLYVLGPIASQCIVGLAQFSPNSRFIALSRAAAVPGADLVIRGSGSALPLAKGSSRGIALDAADPVLLGAAARALVAGGRLVAPSRADLPAGISVVARDAEEWVGVREATPMFSEIRRASR